MLKNKGKLGFRLSVRPDVSAPKLLTVSQR